nr:MAG TPA: hypothetical protein [Caudoviricetes sp.]
MSKNPLYFSNRCSSLEHKCRKGMSKQVWC